MTRLLRFLRRNFWPAFFYLVLPTALLLLATIFWLGPELAEKGFCR